MLILTKQEAAAVLSEAILAANVPKRSRLTLWLRCLAFSRREKALSPFACLLFIARAWNLFHTNTFSFSHRVQAHKSTGVAIYSVSPKPNFQSGHRIKDEFLMERVSCLLASSHVQLIYPSASALLVKDEALCITNPASFMLQVNVFSPGSQKVTAGCFSSCGLWAMWLSLNPLSPPSHCSAASAALCQTDACQSQGCWLASLLSTCWSPPLPCMRQGPEATALKAKVAPPLTLTVKLSLMPVPLWQPCLDQAG